MYAYDLVLDQQSTLALSSIVQYDFAGIPINPEASGYWEISRLLRLLEMSPILAEGDFLMSLAVELDIAENILAYDCGPMSLAVLANDSDEVARLLARHPDSVLEQNSVGQTALHFAANKPSCLRLLVQASAHSLLNQRDGSGRTPLQYAMQMSGYSCVHRSNRHKCSRCRCAECVAILLNADCEVPFAAESYLYHFGEASERARRRFVSHFKNRRQRLLRLAQDNHPIISKGGLSLEADALPDAIAPQIIDLLRANNVTIPPALDIPVPRSRFRSVFQLLSDVGSAILFFRSGFRDIDALFNGQTPLTVRSIGKFDPEYLQWLIENGADLFRLIVPSRQIPDSRGTRGTFTAHSLLFTVGDGLTFWTNLRSNNDDWNNTVGNLISRTISPVVQDGCICACSNDGCTQSVYLLKGIGSRLKKHGLRPRPGILEDNAELTIQFFEPLENALDVQLQLSSIRWITFEALGLTHTCCNPKEVLYTEISHTGIETEDLSLEGEAPEVLDMFEHMVEELQEAAQNTYAATSSLVHFWTQIWASRVQKELEKLRGNNLSEKEREGSEAIGVKWHHQPQQEEKPVSIDTGNPYRWGKWESVQWKDRQLRPEWCYTYRPPVRPRASAFQSDQEESSEDSSWTTESSASSSRGYFQEEQ